MMLESVERVTDEIEQLQKGCDNLHEHIAAKNRVIDGFRSEAERAYLSGYSAGLDDGINENWHEDSGREALEKSKYARVTKGQDDG